MSVLDDAVREVAALHGTTPALVRAVATVLAAPPTGLGLDGLARHMDCAGLGDVVRSWAADGPLQPVTAAQLRACLPRQELRVMELHSGLSQSVLLAELEEHLPRIVRAISRTK